MPTGLDGLEHATSSCAFVAFALALVGTGVEKLVARDSGTSMSATTTVSLKKWMPLES